MTAFPDVAGFGSLVELLDDAATRWPAQPPMWSLRTDDGIELPWSAAEMRRRSLLAAWRLRAWGLQPGDRLLTWSPSTPRLPAVYWGAMRAGVVIVPLDLRMTPGVIERISARADTKWLAVDSGYDAPDPASVGLDHFTVWHLEDLVAEPDATFPDDWETQVTSWPPPTRDSLFEVIFTSGTTADPKGVKLTHGNILETLASFGTVVPPRHQRTVSILPLSHLFEQGPVLFYATSIGAEVAYVRSRNPRVIFEALRELRVTVMIVTPQILELFWNALSREIERRGQGTRFERARRLARHVPYRLRRLVFRSLHAQLGGELRLMVCAGAYLPPDLQMAWEDLGIAIVQGYGSTECGIIAVNDPGRHPVATVGRVRAPSVVRLDPGTSEIHVRGPNISPGYWRDDGATAASRDGDWMLTGDTGHFTESGDLVLSGRIRNVIALPNGFKVFPEDIEAALSDHGISQSVVLESSPGRIEAIVLPPGAQPTIPGSALREPADPASGDEAVLRARIDAIVKAANAGLSMHQRIAGWRLWPEPDFPRTHTLKIRRNEVRAWAGDETVLKVREVEAG